jgi:hypothetical protein
MSFLKKLVNEFEEGQDSRGQQAYPSQSYNNDSPPQVPPPWIAEWDNRDNRWIYINRQTGQRTFEHPQQSYGGGGYGQQQQYGGGYGQEQPQKKDHHGRNMALMGVAGLAGGALLMHEGENVSK